MAWGSSAYRSGLYLLENVQLYVNRGLGNTWLPLRLNARPEATSITLRSAMAPAGVSPTPTSSHRSFPFRPYG